MTSTFDLGVQEKQVATASLAVKEESAEEVNRPEPMQATVPASPEEADAAAADAVRQSAAPGGSGRGRLSGGKR
ncbi:MAG: hypothetical protein QM784_18935 [Polyangiaceae bacterium]